MDYHKNLKKFISTVVIVAFTFQSNIFLHSQEKDEDLIQLEKSIAAYLAGQDDSSKMRLERLIGTIKAKGLELKKKDILGKCYLLIGAISEKKGETNLAEENYRRAKDEYGVESVPGTNLDDLPLYKKVVKGEIDIETQFQKGIDEYNNGQYDNSKNTLEQIIGTIKKEDLEVKRNDILGKCYLLLGAIYEKKGESILAEDNYLKAKKEYAVESIKGVELDDLPIYKRAAKGEISEGIKEQEILSQLKNAKNDYNKKDYESSKKRIERIIREIIQHAINRKDIWGKCYLLLGAISEKKGKSSDAKENYNKAIRDYGIIKIDGINLDNLPLYKKIRKEGIIEFPIKPPGKRKKAITEHWIVKGVGVVALVAAFFLLSKKEPKENSQPPDENIIEFITSVEGTSKNPLYVPEGGIATFEIWLSAQPSSEISVSLTLIAVERDSTIYILSNSNLTFTTTQAQTVTLGAYEDLDTSNDKSTIRISAIGMAAKDIIVIEQDNDK